MGLRTYRNWKIMTMKTDRINKFFRLVAMVVVSTMAFGACSTNPSVQRYIVDHENREGFASFTVPAGIIQIQENAEVDPESAEALNKLNNLVVLRYERFEEAPELFEEYLTELHTCLSPERYEDIFMMNDGKMRFSLKVKQGNSNRLNEVIALMEQSDSFMLARLTGEIEPDKLAQLIRKIDYRSMMENEQLKGLIGS